ncbi:hypothetical protein M758_6G090500 [Ceratodon purpureus]|uniref:Uncharacterized protein n=1 Tax=Ceratodon purpureus TaxID=3225 RepID=A0A8T0HFT8_CERPU|nr:hypothetical protein KC19_6G094000 [Ceratodon purpureus]KAG0569490.1 hypothetical protein KC19_6G094200 [Ceratodon purpureus]KAG0613280.1 hypothetical protein M758_6G090500 [Ceratodon purpureus]
MAPSAPITLPAPLPAPAFGSSDRLGVQSNGHSLGSAQKVPGKSNLKQKPTTPSTSHSGNGTSTGEGKEARFGDAVEDGGERGQGEGERGTRVQWIDNYGKDLTQVFEFEPSSDSDDSEDDDDDSDSSQACTCVIQ